MNLRILIWDLPTMTREILKKTLSAASDWIVEAPEKNGAGLTEAIDTFNPDVIITPSARTELDEACAGFIASCALRKVLRMSSVGREVYIHRLRPERISINDVSERQLLEAIQEMVSEKEHGL